MLEAEIYIYEDLKLKLFCFDVQNNFRFRSGKFSQKHRNQQTIDVKFWFNRKNMELSHIYIAVKEANSSNLSSKTFSFYLREVSNQKRVINYY